MEESVFCLPGQVTKSNIECRAPSSSLTIRCQLSSRSVSIIRRTWGWSSPCPWICSRRPARGSRSSARGITTKRLRTRIETISLPWIYRINERIFLDSMFLFHLLFVGCNIVTVYWVWVLCKYCQIKFSNCKHFFATNKVLKCMNTIEW